MPPITVPAGTNVRLYIRPPHHALLAAPPGVEADLDKLLCKPNVVPLFVHDAGVTWPDRDECRWASKYLETGHAIAFQFDTLADALSCHKRLVASGAKP